MAKPQIKSSYYTPVPAIYILNLCLQHIAAISHRFIRPRSRLVGVVMVLLLQIALPAGAEDKQIPVYKFGVMPWQRGQSDDDIRALYKPMMDWMGRRLDCKFLIIEARNYEQAIKFLADGTVDLAHVSPVPYVLAKKSNPQLELLATALQWNREMTKKKDSYLGYILTLKIRDDINNVDDLKGRRFGFVDESSSSGYNYPVSGLSKAGIYYKRFFRKYYFLGSHPRVTDAIAAGSIDAGTTWDFNLKLATLKHGDIFKIISTTPPIPNTLIAAHPNLPEQMRASIRRALLDIEPRLLRGHIEVGFTMKSDAFYDVVREMLAIRDGGKTRHH